MVAAGERVVGKLLVRDWPSVLIKKMAELLVKSF